MSRNHEHNKQTAEGDLEVDKSHIVHDKCLVLKQQQQPVLPTTRCRSINPPQSHARTYALRQKSSISLHLSTTPYRARWRSVYQGKHLAPCQGPH